MSLNRSVYNYQVIDVSNNVCYILSCHDSSERSGQNKIPKCFLRKEIPAKKRVHRNFRTLDFKISMPPLSTKVQLTSVVPRNACSWQLKKADVRLNRKMLAQLAVVDPASFTSVVGAAQG